MPLVSIDGVSVAHGYVPLLDAVSLLVEARERIAIIGRNGTGKSHAAPCDLRRAAARCGARSGVQPGVRVARPRCRTCPLSDARAGVRRRGRRAGRPERAGPHLPSRGDRGRAARHRRARSSGSAHCSTSSKSATAGASSSASSWCSPAWSCPPTPSSTRCRAAGGGACCWRARWWRSRTCCCSTSRPTTSTSTRSSGSSRSSRSMRAPSCSSRTIARSSQRLATRIVELDRGRLTSWPGDYADLPAQEGGVARQRGAAAREVRQEAGRGRSVAAPAASRRGGRATKAACKALMAMREERAARRERARQRAAADRARPIRPGKLVFEAEEVTQAFGGAPVVVARFLHADHARRSHRPDRAERRRQDHAAAVAARRARAGQRQVRHGANVAGRVLRSAARAARSRAHRVRHRRRRQRHGDGQRPHASRPRLSARTSCSPRSARARR